MKSLTILLLLLTVGCAASPRVNIDKRVIVIGNCNKVTYTTKAEVITDAETEQTISPKTDFKLK